MKKLLKKNSNLDKYNNAIKLAKYVNNLKVPKSWFVEAMSADLDINEEELKQMSIPLIIYNYDVDYIMISDDFCEL